MHNVTKLIFADILLRKSYEHIVFLAIHVLQLSANNMFVARLFVQIIIFDVFLFH